MARAMKMVGKLLVAIGKAVAGELSKPKPKAKQEYIFLSDEEIADEARKAAAKVKTHKGLEALEDRRDAVYDSIEESATLLTEQKRIEKHRILEAAADIANQMPFRYYLPADEVDVFTPLETINLVGKTFTQERYSELDENTKKMMYSVAFGDMMDANEVSQEAKENMGSDFRIIKKFREIVENVELDVAGKRAKINDLVSKSDFLKDFFDDPEEYADEESDNSYYGQFLAYRPDGKE